MWGSIASAVARLLAKVAAFFGAFLAGEEHQQAKDEAKVIDAAKTRAAVENADAGLTDQQVLDRLRPGK
jgi:hypothetical protein